MSGSGAGAPPAVFVSHGAPTLLLEGGPAVDFLAGLGRELGKPSAVVCLSAHWETDAPAVSAAAHPETIHDFSGFPPELHAMRYPAAGAPALAERVRALLADAGLPCAVDPARGLDHGAWVPMKLMYPAADVPILQLSVQPHRDPAHHLAVGRALARMRGGGVLVLGSGGAIHNLRALRWGADTPEAWATGFADWLDRAVAAGATDDLVHYRERSPGGTRAHPTDEHFLPLFVALGAGGAGKGKRLHTSFTHGNLGMQAYAWESHP
jgi:4,5-DOPA dioxygenase extradiol